MGGDSARLQEEKTQQNILLYKEDLKLFRKILQAKGQRQRVVSITTSGRKRMNAG